MILIVIILLDPYQELNFGHAVRVFDEGAVYSSLTVQSLAKNINTLKTTTLLF